MLNTPWENDGQTVFVFICINKRVFTSNKNSKTSGGVQECDFKLYVLT